MSTRSSAGAVARPAPRGLFLALLGLLVLAPVPLGSNRPWAWAPLEVAVFLLLGLWCLGRALGRRPEPTIVHRLRLPLGLLGLWLGYLWLQTLPLPLDLVRLLTPHTAALYTTAQQAVGGVVAGLAADRGAAQIELLKNAAYVGILLLTLVLVDSPTRLKALALTLVLVGIAEALYGLAGYLAGDSLGLWEPPTGGHHVAHGTFVNRNHYGAHLAMTMALLVGILLSSAPRAGAGRRWRARLQALLDAVLTARALLYLGAVLMLAALMLSGSRGASLSLVFGLGTIVVLGARWRGRGSGETRVAALVVVLALVAGLWLGTGVLGPRLVASIAGSDGRLEVWSQSLKVVADYPVLGVGAGGFQWVLPGYRSGPALAYYDHAHNDYLETLVDYGVLGCAPLAAALWLLLARLLVAYRRRSSRYYRGMLFGSLAGCLTMLAHAMLDFNFHIPANAAYFYALLGLGLVASQMERYREPSPPRPRHRLDAG